VGVYLGLVEAYRRKGRKEGNKIIAHMKRSFEL
jgi:hypothetical protein